MFPEPVPRSLPACLPVRLFKKVCASLAVPTAVHEPEALENTLTNALEVVSDTISQMSPSFPSLDLGAAVLAVTVFPPPAAVAEIVTVSAVSSSAAVTLVPPTTMSLTIS